MQRLLILVLALLPSAAAAASLESLVMPGPVIEGHAEVEDDCSACHAPFSQDTQPGLCLDCHEEIAADLEAARGFHGAGHRLVDTACRACHTEHEGRDADILGLIPEAFDHALTGFELAGSHSALSCSDCHAPADTYRVAEPQCASCHGDDDPHRGNLGEDCGSCHGATDWLATTFDHLEVAGFALEGGHAGVSCSACHAGQIYEGTPTACASCHALDDVHRGERGDACGDCHGVETWTDSRFDHAAETGFALSGVHADLACASCHLDGMALEQPPDDCVGCHSAQDVHQGRRGPACGDCHGEQTWDVAFDHLARTGFALRGAHGALACSDCHLGSLTDAVATQCADCHRHDDPHAGALPDCGNCHGETQWNDEVRFDHEFTNFPLLGMHRLAVCDQCHADQDFHATPAACVECHAGDDGHEGSLGVACDDCHVPSGWTLWQFDHDTRTDFALTGAHRDLVCAACHVPGDPDAMNVSQACASCHQVDDVHNGQFGRSCDRCHSTTSFSDDAGFFR